MNAPIGIIDSGVGGLTVAKEVMRQLPYVRLFPNKYWIPTRFTQEISTNCMASPKDATFVEQLISDIEYIPIQERIIESENFVELAIEYSTTSEIAIEVKQLPGCIVATYFFDFLLEENPSKDILADLIKMCDCVDLYKPTDNETGILKLILTYKTHEHYIKN